MSANLSRSGAASEEEGERGGRSSFGYDISMRRRIVFFHKR